MQQKRYISHCIRCHYVKKISVLLVLIFCISQSSVVTCFRRPDSYVDLRLQKSRAKYYLRKFYFTNRVVNIWNSLTVYVVHADTVNWFKSRLDKKFWSNQELIDNFPAEICGAGS